LGILLGEVTDAGVGKGGGVVGVGGFEVTDFAPKFAVSFARDGYAAWALVDPGVVGFWTAAGTRDERTPATNGVGESEV